jgi:signal transduction histidine kinase
MSTNDHVRRRFDDYGRFVDRIPNINSIVLTSPRGVNAGHECVLVLSQNVFLSSRRCPRRHSVRSCQTHLRRGKTKNMEKHRPKIEEICGVHRLRSPRKYLSTVNGNSIRRGHMVEKASPSVTSRLIEAQEQERDRIARELHDDIGQRLALLAVKIEQVRDGLPRESAEIRRCLDQLWHVTTQIATDTQSLSHELHSSKLEHLGLVTAVRSFCKEFGKAQKIEIAFKNHDVPMLLPKEFALCLFRIVQEALQNSAKHSGALQIEVQLWATPDQIHLTVSDSGAGFEPAATTGRGLGLISMDERLQSVNGTLSIKSVPKCGTTIYARIPLHSRSDSTRSAE